ncbi:hypothetical protein HBNCFIEN_01094 [Legionella sp. PC997]|nr:hypothetical protein HBNCFIEN_01094 [Legionella sp. PC997]
MDLSGTKPENLLRKQIQIAQTNGTRVKLVLWILRHMVGLQSHLAIRV